MGLTIHYRLALRPKAPDLDADYARWAVEDARSLALKMKRRGSFDEVSPIGWDAHMRGHACEWLLLPVAGDDHTQGSGVSVHLLADSP